MHPSATPHIPSVTASLSKSIDCVPKDRKRINSIINARPRMVARSAINSKCLSTNLSVAPPPTDSRRPLSMRTTNRNTTAYAGIHSTDQNHPDDYPRPLSTPPVHGRTPSHLQPYTFPIYADNLNNPTDDGTNLLNIDDLLIRRNRSTHKISSVRRDRSSRDTQNQRFVHPPNMTGGGSGGGGGGGGTGGGAGGGVNVHLRNPTGHLARKENETKLKDDVKEEHCVPPVRVELMLIFVKVGQVDTVNERYQADVFLQARWREPLLDARWNANTGNKQNWRPFGGVENPVMELTPKRHLQSLRLQDDEFWNPRLLLDNAQGEPVEIVSHEVEFVEPDYEAYLVEKRRIKGVFHETLELRHFPFDCQDLSVTVTCDRTVEEVELVPSPTEVSQVDRRCAADSQEWNIFHHVDIASMEIQTAYSPGNSKRCHPGLVFTSRSARRAGYFMVNMALISCVLSLLSFSVFSVPVDGNRLQLALLLLLTTVTFKFAASQNLPKISYLTNLDKIVLANFFMLVMLTVWHTIARCVSVSYPELLDNERYVVYTLLSSYCLGAVIFGLTVYLDAGSRRRLMKRKDVEFIQHKLRIEREKERRSIVTVALDEWLNSPGATVSEVGHNPMGSLLDMDDRFSGSR